MSDQQIENLGSFLSRSIMERKDVYASAKLVYMYIDGWTRNGKDCWASNATIGEWCGIGERTASDAVKELVSLGLVASRYDSDNTRHLVSTPLATPATPSSNSCNTPLATPATNYIKDNIKDTQISDEDKDAQRAMEAAYGQKPKRKSPVVTEPDESPTRPQSFLDLLAVWGIAPIDDKWEYRAWMACLAAGGKPEQILAEAKNHVKKASSPQFIGNLQNWLKVGAWRKPIKQSQTAYTAPRALFPDASQLLLSGATEAHLEALGRSYDDCKRWWASHPSPTRKLLIEKISQEMLKNSVDTAKSQ